MPRLVPRRRSKIVIKCCWICIGSPVTKPPSTRARHCSSVIRGGGGGGDVMSNKVQIHLAALPIYIKRREEDRFALTRGR